MSDHIPPTDEESLEGMPRFIRSWKQAYWLLFGFLVLLITLFYWFSKAWA